jgi:polar amino acid transport system permease protein
MVPVSTTARQAAAQRRGGDVGYQFQFGVVWANFDELLYGAALTLQLSLAAGLLGLLVGIAGAWARKDAQRPARWLVQAYVEAIRNTPFLVQCFLIYLGLPWAGVRLSPGTAALVALTVNVGAYTTEIVRAGIEAIPRGQIEAATALGLRRAQIFLLIVLKPALRVVYPALASQFILLMLGSSVVSAISAEELTAAANTLQSRTFRSFEIYLVAAGMYLAMSIGLRALLGLGYRGLVGARLPVVRAAQA